jgi:methylglutamate dehydrogenase subunit B
MRIACVYCGERGNEEFTYLGDATVARPESNADLPLDEIAMRRWHDYVYLRVNPAGAHRELWHHIGGCRAWLVITRNVSTHEIIAVEEARVIAAARPATNGAGAGR